MTSARRAHWALTLGAVAMLALAPPPLRAQRTVEYTLRSPTEPSMAVHVSSDLRYLGPLTYDVGGLAQAEAHVFVDAEDGQLRRVFIAHFEHFLPTNDQRFLYPRLAMTTLGDHEYLHQTWAFKACDLFTDPPMRQFLERHGLRAEPSWIMDRYVRVVDDTRKHEVIFFYLEAASLNSSSVHYGGAPVAPPPPPTPPDEVTRALVARARAAFQVTDLPSGR